MRFRGSVVTDVNRVEGHEVIPDAAKAGREGNHTSTAVQEGRRKMSSYSHTFLGMAHESFPYSQSLHMASANCFLSTRK